MTFIGPDHDPEWERIKRLRDNFTITINPNEELLTASGKLLDRCAEALGLPLRDIEDDTGHDSLMESDRSYRRRLAAHLRSMATALESKS